ARVRPEATSVWLEAPDFGAFAGVTSDHYVKDVPLEQVLRDDVLLAWAMNGAPLTIEHGFPLRAFVPGFFGTNAVKWLSRIPPCLSPPRDSVPDAATQSPAEGERPGDPRAGTRSRRPRGHRQPGGWRTDRARRARDQWQGVERLRRDARRRQRGRWSDVARRD